MKRRKFGVVVTRKQALTTAMHRALEWSQTLDDTGERDQEWERQFRYHVRARLRQLRKLK